MLMVSVLAAAIGLAAGFIAFLLYNLIGLFTNIAFFHRFSFAFSSPRFTPFGAWVIVIPVVGGLIVGLMARFGSPKIRGHGIPEAMEAVLVNRSRIEPKLAVLKPISAAIAIGTGGPSAPRAPSSRRAGPSVRSLARSFTPRPQSARCCSLAEQRPGCPRPSTRRLPA